MSVKRQLVVVALVALVSAAVGAGATLLIAKQGPRGSRGPLGAQGERGPRGSSGHIGGANVLGLETAVTESRRALRISSALRREVGQQGALNAGGAANLDQLNLELQDLQNSWQRFCAADPSEGGAGENPDLGC